MNSALLHSTSTWYIGLLWIGLMLGMHSYIIHIICMLTSYTLWRKFGIDIIEFTGRLHLTAADAGPGVWRHVVQKLSFVEVMPRPHSGGIKQWCASDCLKRISGLSREQRGLGILKLAQLPTWLGHHFQGQKINLQGAGHIVAASHTACLHREVRLFLSYV